MVSIEDLETHILEGERCHNTLGHILLGKSLSTKDFWQREDLTLVSRDLNLVNTTNNINFLVLVLVLHICLRTSFRLAHTAQISRSPRTSHKTLLASLSPATFSFGTSKGEGETAARTTNLVFAWDELMSSSTMKLSSDML